MDQCVTGDVTVMNPQRTVFNLHLCFIRYFVRLLLRKSRWGSLACLLTTCTLKKMIPENKEGHNDTHIRII